MLGASAVILLALVVQGHADDLAALRRMEQVTDRIADNLLDRPLRRRLSPNQHAGMDNVALGKSAQLAIPTSRVADKMALQRYLASPASLRRPRISTSSYTSVVPSEFSPMAAVRSAPQERRFRQIPARASAGASGLDVDDVARTTAQRHQVEVVHSEADLEKVIQQTSGLVVLEVDDQPVQTSGPKYERLAGYYDKVKFLRIAGKENESTNRVVTERFNAKSTPSFYFLRNGEVVGEQKNGNVDELASRLNHNFLSVDLMSA